MGFEWGGCGCSPLCVFWFFVWGCFLGFFVVWRVFLCSFGVVLVLFGYWLATVLLEGLVGVVSGCFSGSFRCLAVFSCVVGVLPSWYCMIVSQRLFVIGEWERLGWRT